MAKSNSNCPVTRGEVDLDYYANLDGNWRALGLPAPARRALVNDKLLELKHLTKHTRSHVSALHGMGPKSVRMLEAALAELKLSFKQN